ncbi:hypothetical protein SprV_0401624400 [Sparganum proliferum]
MDIAVPSETFFSEQGQPDEMGDGYNFLQNELPKGKRRGTEVAFAIRTDVVGRLHCLPQDISDPAITMTQPLRRNRSATAVGAYTPNDQFDDEKNKL